MKAGSFLSFNIFRSQPGLVSGIFNKNFGNFSLKYDTKKKIEANKKKIAQALGIKWQNIHSVKQIHSDIIKIIEEKSFTYPETEADGLITNKKNIFLLIKTADCFPVLFFDPKNKAVAAIHVGWRGAIEKIFLTALLKMINNFNCQIKDILVGIGPGIEKCCFKHKNLIQQKLPEWQSYIKKDKDGFSSLDVLKFIYDKLVDIGVKNKNIETMNICTSCSNNFFSHFRSLKTGEPEKRFAAIIGISNEKN